MGRLVSALCLVRHRGLIALVMVSSLTAVGSASSTTAQVRSLTDATGSPATLSQVEKAVAKGASVTKVPSTLQPDLLHGANDIEHVYNQDCALGEKKDDATFGECVYGNPKAKRTFILFGDSHAGMWFDGLREAATLAGWSMRIFYKTGCPAPMITFYTDGAACNAFRASAIAAIRRLHPQMVIVTSASFEQAVSKSAVASSSQWLAGMTSTLRRLKSPQTKLVILGDIPLLSQSDPECLAAHESNVQACATPRDDALKGVYGDAEAAAAKATGAQRIDVTNWLCSSICPPIINNILVYRNQFHITRTYSLYLAGVLRAALHLSG